MSIVGLLAAWAALLPVTTEARVMPFGDSMTTAWYTASRVTLSQSFPNVKFVGSVKIPSELQAYEGHPGFTVKQLDDGFAAWYKESRPSIVLFQAGANSIVIEVGGAQNGLKELRSFFDNHLKCGATFLVTPMANIPGGMEPQVSAFNEGLVSMVRTYAKKGLPVHLVQAAPKWSEGDLQPDNIHPTDQGAQKLGRGWERELRTFLSRNPTSPKG